ncbi:pectinesterase family protein [Pedobacter sp. P351]|uniref:pectinesterase family protein n=1 Tax=Pedobacter superstes TaxID=3133441 RepID=UPI0030B54D44
MIFKLIKRCLLLSFTLIAFSFCKTSNSKPLAGLNPAIEALSVKPDKVVAADGSGDFKTIQAAVDAAPSGLSAYYLIYIKEGVYKEVVTIPRNKTFIYFRGESADKTILTYDNFSSKLDPNGVAYGTSRSSSVFIKATNFKAENLTFENSAGINAGQALAISIQADLAAFRNCKFLGNQDTYYAAVNTTQYLKNCHIAGTVDFMFGGSTAVFESCTIHSLKGGYVTAASTPQGKKYGYVYLNCKLTGIANDASVYLGRPWRPYANVVYIDCEMGKHIRSEGWNNWNNSANETTAFYAEYNSTGEGYKPGKRQKWSNQLTKLQAQDYTVAKILGAWKPF